MMKHAMLGVGAAAALAALAAVMLLPGEPSGTDTPADARGAGRPDYDATATAAYPTWAATATTQAMTATKSANATATVLRPTDVAVDATRGHQSGRRRPSAASP